MDVSGITFGRMSNMFFAKGEKVMDLVDRHLISVRNCLSTFSEFLVVFSKDGLTDETRTLGKKVEELESQADADRHKIIRSLLKGALLPDTRREILRLIELVDEVANQCEEIVKQIILQRIEFTGSMKDKINTISDLTVDQFSLLEKAIGGLFKQLQSEEANLELLSKIENIESDVDDIENELLQVIYDSEMGLAEKNQMSRFVAKIADISDVIEDISDTIEIILAIRKA